MAGLIILAGVFILTGGLILAFLNRSMANAEAVKLPKTIGNFELTTATYGPEAVAEITRMHGKEFPTTSGAMGMYGDANQISLWIEGFENNSTASQILHAMQQKNRFGQLTFLTCRGKSRRKP